MAATRKVAQERAGQELAAAKQQAAAAAQDEANREDNSQAQGKEPTVGSSRTPPKPTQCRIL